MRVFIRRKNYYFIVLLFIISKIVFAAGKTVDVDNGLIIVSVDKKTGMFSILGRNNERSGYFSLLGNKGKQSSFATINIDGINYRFGSDLGNIEYTKVIADKFAIITKYVIEKNISVKQILQITGNRSTGFNNSVSISYKIENNSLNIKKIGIRLTLDTVLGSKDNGVILIPGRDPVSTDTVIYTEGLSDRWFTYSEGSLNSMAYISGPGLETPSKIVAAYYDTFLINHWDVPIYQGRKFTKTKEEKIYNSAVAYYFTPVALKPAEKFIYSTKFGILGADILSKDKLTIILLAPKIVPGIPFTASLYVFNNNKRDLNSPKVALYFSKNEKLLGLSITDYQKKEKKLIMSQEWANWNWDLIMKKAKKGTTSFFIRLDYEITGKVKKILLERKVTITKEAIPSIRIRLDRGYFSPNGDGKFDTATFNIQTFNIGKPKFWELKISDFDRVIKTFMGTEKIADKIVWDGKNDLGEPADEGNYQYFLSITTIDDKTIESKPSPITLDKTAPWVEIKANPSTVSFDPRAENNHAEFFLSAVDNSPIDYWQIDIFDTDGTLFRSLRNIGNPPESIAWEGVDDQGQKIPNGAFCTFTLYAQDVAGNSAVSDPPGELNFEIELKKEKKGLVMNLPNVQFEKGSSELKGFTFKILNKVGELLKLQKIKRIKIEGHTDNQGNRKTNIKLSKDRAKSVAIYLNKFWDFPMENIETEGYGPDQPRASNDTEEGRKQNRRVEIIILDK